MRIQENKGQLISVIVISLIAAVVIIGMSVRERSIVHINDAAADVIPADTMVEMTKIMEPVPEPYVPEVAGAFAAPGKLNLIADGAFQTICKDSAIGWGIPETQTIGADLQKLNYILTDDDKILVGGDRLLVYSDDYAEVYEDCDFQSPINVILKFGEGYLVGTQAGLYFHISETRDTLLKADLEVTCLAEDKGGLWVGTFGDGLWRFDGDHWQRRYLLRDTSIFDFVNTLAYSYPHLWVGTPSGIFKFNGGSWSQLFAADSSEVYEVNTILPLALSTYIGTEQGLYVYANDTLKAVPDFNAERIAALTKADKEIIVTTRDNGIYKLNGKEEILRPEQLMAEKTMLANK